MDWTALSELRAFPRLASVGIMLGLAAWLVTVWKSSHAHRAFALFLSGFALAVFFNTMGAFAAPGGKEAWFTLTKHAEFLEIPALLYFLAVYPFERGWLGTSRLMLANLALGVLAIELWFLVDPGIWYASPDSRSGLTVGVSGPVGVLAKDNLWMALVAIVLARESATCSPGRAGRRSSSSGSALR